jgi:AcrR family transcriptional regulator
MAEQRREPVRENARRNRARILEVAQRALTEPGEVSMNAIAKEAGVGPGTLYRHFPNRETLIVAVYRQEMDRLAAYAPELLEVHPPLVALRLWFDRLAYYGRIKHALADVLHAITDDGLAGETYEAIIGAITTLLNACEQDGSIRPGVDPDDVLLAMGFLWRTSPDPEGRERAERLLALFIDGLRFRAPAPRRNGE